MALRLVITPTIHVVVEDSDVLTDNVRDRISTWLTLPEYEPNSNGDLIRAEHIHGGSEFVAVAEGDMESVESKPYNYETRQFLEPMQVVTIQWDLEKMQMVEMPDAAPHPAVDALQEIVREEKYDSEASHIARYALERMGETHHYTTAPQPTGPAPTIESGKPEHNPEGLRAPEDVTPSGWHRIADDLRRFVANLDAYVIEEYVTTGQMPSGSYLSARVRAHIVASAKSYGIDISRCKS